jgi:tetratricopeptide (TPR) repeat protein
MLHTTRDVYTTINYNLPDTATREAIDLLKRKSEKTDETINLTRNEILLLSKALQDLDQRTSGLHKLPDGRTQFGHLISGEPRIVLQEIEAAQRLFKAGDYNQAFEYAQRAIKAYEDTKQLQTEFRTGDLTPEAIATLYGMGALTAQKLQKHELAFQYATQVVENQSTPVAQELLATTLANIGKVDEAMVAINKAVEAQPNNKDLLQLRDQISKKAIKP